LLTSNPIRSAKHPEKPAAYAAGFSFITIRHFLHFYTSYFLSPPSFPFSSKIVKIADCRENTGFKYSLTALNSNGKIQ